MIFARTLRWTRAAPSMVGISMMIVLLPSCAAVKAPTAKALGEEFSKIAAEVSPAVVHIAAERTVTIDVPGIPEDFLRRFFGDGPESPFGGENRERRLRGLGSGMIVDEEGHVITNSHVVDKAEELTVKLQDRREFTATLVGTDPDTDIAVLKIEGEDLPRVNLGDSESLDVGDLVLAIGNPFALDRTVSFGIVSAKGRANMGITEYEDFIQTDAAINPGNSGGPMVNMDGEVIGVNTAIFSQTGGNLGIGFAVPINMAKTVMRSIIDEGYVSRGYLGVYIQTVSPDLAEAMQLDRDTGVLVTKVIEDSPAEESGLQRGDLIISIDGAEVEAVHELRNRVAATRPGKKINLEIIRDGERKDMSVRMKQKPTEAARSKSAAADLGFDVSDLNSELKERFGIEESEGVVVVAVKRGGPAAEAGLRPGMMILEVNRDSVADVSEFNERLRESPEGKDVLLLVAAGTGYSYVLIQQGG